MKRLFCICLVCILAVLGLVSCNGDGEVKIPDGMQIVHQNTEEGYIFFGPEGWVVANRGGIDATYLSTFNKTSITFASLDMPEDKNAEGKLDLNAYFDRTSSLFPYAIQVITKGESVNFGTAESGADKAYKYVYSYEYSAENVTCMQIMVIRGDDFFVFTYTGTGKIDDEGSNYRLYLEKAQAAVDSMIFTDKGTSGNTSADYEVDEDGYILISDSTFSGFDLYVPADYTVVDSSGLVSARISDGANISLSRASETGKSVLDYLLDRRADVIGFADAGSFKDIKITVARAVNTESEYFTAKEENGSLKWKADVLPETDEDLMMGNIGEGKIAAYEYKYEHGGNVYHVYQVLGADSFNGYVFTYTALDGEYAEHINEIKAILRKVEFK